MQEGKTQSILSLLDEELHLLIDAAAQIPYSSLPLEPTYGGQIICFTNRVEALTGYSAEEILADRQLWISIIHPTDRKRVLAVFARCRNHGTRFEIEYRVIHKDGSLRYVIDEGEPVFDDEGQVARIEGIITEVTEYEKARICIGQEKPKTRKTGDVNSSVLQKA